LLEEKRKAQVRARVGHSFRVVKCVFDYVETRFKGLAKNTAQIVTLFALGNLYAARRQLLPEDRTVAPATQVRQGKGARSRENRPKKPLKFGIAFQLRSSDEEFDGLFRGSRELSYRQQLFCMNGDAGASGPTIEKSDNGCSEFMRAKHPVVAVSGRFDEFRFGTPTPNPFTITKVD
jgi:hypothetical protein